MLPGLATLLSTAAAPLVGRDLATALLAGTHFLIGTAFAALTTLATFTAALRTALASPRTTLARGAAAITAIAKSINLQPQQ